MKKNRNYLKMLIFGIIFALSSCNEELYEKAFTNQNVKITKISVKDTKVFSNSKLMQQIENVKNKKLSSRMVYDSINDFYFDDENGMLIEKEDGYKSYTFPVIRSTNNENSKLENIIFSKNENNEFDSYLVKYSFTNKELETSSYEELQGEQTNLLQLNKATEYICIVIKTYGGCSETHSNGYTCSGESSTYDCYNVGGNGSGSSSGGSGGGSNTGGSGTGSGTGTSGQGGSISTTPISGGGSAATNPCKKTKNQLEKYASLKPALVTLTNTVTASQENGIFIYDTSTSTTVNPVQNLPNITISGVTAVGLPNPTAPNKYTIIAHTHDASGPLDTGSYSIFSWQDLTRLAELIHDGYIDTENFVFYVSTADGTRYALTTEWPTTFADFFDRRKTFGVPESNTNIDWTKATQLDIAEKKFFSNAALANKIHLTSNKIDDLNIFLKMRKELKLDFTLFEIDPTFTTYTKVSLKNDGTIKRENCN